jgi:hypothetical protein
MRKCCLLIFTLFLILIEISCNDKPVEQKAGNDFLMLDTLRFLTYGMPNFEKQNAENIIAKKWGIEFYAVAGCIVTNKLVDSVEKHNKRIENLAIQRFGKNWEDKFRKEIDTEFETEQKIKTLLTSLKYIAKKDADLEKDGNGLHFYMSPTDSPSFYNVSVSGWGKINGRDEWVSYYRLTVNYSKKKVSLISNEVIKE